MQKRTPRWEAASSRRRGGTGGKQHAVRTGALVALCGAGVGARLAGAATFDPLHPAACRKCTAAVARLARDADGKAAA
jgi:hypothetical protein